MFSKTVLDLQAFFPKSLNVINIDETEKRITIKLKLLKKQHSCGTCKKEMSNYHGTYVRTVQDLPILGKAVTLEITAYEYNCLNAECEQKTFVEDFEGFLSKHNRMTMRLEDFIRALALQTSCEGAAMICKHMGIKVSGDSIIRMLRKLIDKNQPKERGEIIGVDDFAYSKGQSYCIIICDGETRSPVAILEGRNGKTLKEWLKKNKHIKFVTRDRASAYAKVIAKELPNAMQIADRFHLHQNLLKAIKEAINRELPSKVSVPNSVSNKKSDNEIKAASDSEISIVSGNNKKNTGKQQKHVKC